MPPPSASKLTDNELQLAPADFGYTVKVVEGTVEPVLNGKTVTIAPEHELKISVTTQPATNSNAEGGGKVKKNRKEANKTRKNKQEGGKKKLSGFMKFSKQERPNIMKENPGIEFTQVGKKLGEKWRALSDAEKKSYA